MVAGDVASRAVGVKAPSSAPDSPAARLTILWVGGVGGCMDLIYVCIIR